MKYLSYANDSLLVESNYSRCSKLILKYTEQFIHFVLSKNGMLKDLY